MLLTIFSEESAAVLPDRTDINEHAINLEEGRQTLYKKTIEMEFEAVNDEEYEVKAIRDSAIDERRRSASKAPLFGLVEKLLRGSQLSRRQSRQAR